MKEAKNYLFLIISVLTVTILFLFFTKPRIETVKEQNQTLKDERERLAILSKKIEVLANFEEAKLTDWVKRVNFVLPSEKSVETLMFILDRISQEASVSVSNLVFTPGMVTKEKASEKEKTSANRIFSVKENNSFDINLTVDGKISDLKIFFLKINETFLAIKVKKLNISQPVIRGDGLATADLTIEIYHKPVALTLGEISKPISELTKVEQKILEEIQNIELPEETPPIIISRPVGTNPFFED